MRAASKAVSQRERSVRPAASRWQTRLNVLRARWHTKHARNVPKSIDDCEVKRCMQSCKALSLVILISLSFSCPASLCRAQKKTPAADYDFYALAVSSIADVTAEASKLPEIPQRVRVLIEAAKILQPAKKK